jgi:hypothetical protein
MSEEPRAGDRAMARFSAAMSGAVRCAYDKGAISADGATATSKSGPGYFRAVCETVARGGGVWEGVIQRARGSDVVYLFICLGIPNVNTSVLSKFALSKPVDGRTISIVRGQMVADGVALALPVGGTLSWRIDCAAGTVHAHVGDGAWALLFNAIITPAEVALGLHAGVILDHDAEVKLLFFGRVDAAAAPAPKAVAVRAPWG